MYNSCFNWMSVLCDGNRLVLEILLSSILFRVHVNFQSDYWLITVYCLHVLTANNTRSLVGDRINFILSCNVIFHCTLLFIYSRTVIFGGGFLRGFRPPGGNKPILDYISIKSTLD